MGHGRCNVWSLDIQFLVPLRLVPALACTKAIVSARTEVSKAIKPQWFGELWGEAMKYMMIWRYSALQRIDALLHLCDVLANASSTQDHVITLETITVDSYKYQLIVTTSKGTVWHGKWTVTGLPFLQNKRWPHAMYYNVIICHHHILDILVES